MTIQVRLNEYDQVLFNEIKEALKEEYRFIFNEIEISNSEALRYCIRRTHNKLLDED